MELITPTAERVREACGKFDRENEDVEAALTELFRQYPRNVDLSHVLLKVSAVNTFYSTRIYLYSSKVPDLLDLATHIHENAESIDAGLAAGTCHTVDLVGEIEVAPKGKRNYFSFASKYCSWHNQNEYPIWDSNVARYLGRLRKETGFAPEFNIHGHWKYPAFRAAMDDFKKTYELGEFSFKQIDKFLWCHGEKPLT